MRITGLRPMLWTEDLMGTIDFYVDVLGFTANEVSDDWGWASLCLDNVSIMLAGPNEHVPYDKIGFTGSFYFETDDVEAMWLKVKDKARICYDIERSSGECASLRFMIITDTRCSSDRKLANR